MRKERAFLVGLEYRTRKRPSAKNLTSGAQAARNTATAATSHPVSDPQFSAEESLGELRDLAISAGAEIAGEILQRRDRPDPATLIGRGKLEEIAGAAAVGFRRLCCSSITISPHPSSATLRTWFMPASSIVRN